MTTTDHNHHNPRQLAEDALRLADTATSGPWHWNGDYEPLGEHSGLEDYGDSWIIDTPDMEHHIGFIAMTADNCEEGGNNAEFVVQARQLVPDLATALLAALGANDELVKLCNDYKVVVEGLEVELNRLKGELAGSERVVEGLQGVLGCYVRNCKASCAKEIIDNGFKEVGIESRVKGCS